MSFTGKASDPVFNQNLSLDIGVMHPCKECGTPTFFHKCPRCEAAFIRKYMTGSFLEVLENVGIRKKGKKWGDSSGK